ncbi:putative vomeronasal receptor-like protein 4 [Ictidomys tridecemlineatus]|uniref:putative vomeronasal receptor-like protein 4 n=1 Tax=Ictidomys tridecemlineatus TaxID=43179 RepID=UPI00038C2333|nr:putative vomeronasal receptor-like protein 4 [Ictidomys tridecemlineatus]KAG3281172.1 putative vomeronasal receptor-like protein 4 [Ictidomys tridecemlineatus]
MDQRFSYDAIRNAFYPQAGIGIAANTFLLYLHTAAAYVGHKPRVTDLPVTHLALTHTLMLLTMGLLVSTDIWETQEIPGDFKCKVLVFLHKVMRGLSICTTCVLSVLQAIIISPSGSWLAHFKLKSTNPIVGLFVFLWVLTMSLSCNLLFCTVATLNKTQPGLLFVTDRCSLLPVSHIRKSFFLTLMACRDVFFVGLMVLSSGYMVLLLYRHTQRSQHLRNSRFPPKSSPEQRATQSILLLICCFAVLYCADSLISMAIGMKWTNNAMLVCVHILVANGYGTVSPLVLIAADTQLTKITHLTCGEKKPFSDKTYPKDFSTLIRTIFSILQNFLSEKY